jgi:uncharacterized protein (DUF1697 family)
LLLRIGTNSERFDAAAQVLALIAGIVLFVGAVVAGHPFPAAEADEQTLHVMFLADPPNPRRVAELDSERSPPDEFVVRGREIYLRLPNGAGRSKLTNADFDTKLATITTVRNWRTVSRLLELVNG